jgi:hypothetical protein
MQMKSQNAFEQWAAANRTGRKNAGLVGFGGRLLAEVRVCVQEWEGL